MFNLKKKINYHLHTLNISGKESYFLTTCLNSYEWIVSSLYCPESQQPKVSLKSSITLNLLGRFSFGALVSTCHLEEAKDASAVASCFSEKQRMPKTDTGYGRCFSLTKVYGRGREMFRDDSGYIIGFPDSVSTVSNHRYPPLHKFTLLPHLKDGSLTI